jgi:hypothetical protein
MKEELPPPLPDQDPKKAPPPAPNAPPLWAMIVVGLFLFGLSVGLFCLVQNSVVRLTPFLLTLLGTTVTLFFRGYRGIFFGFYIALGISLLIAVAVCFGIVSSPHSFK